MRLISWATTATTVSSLSFLVRSKEPRNNKGAPKAKGLLAEAMNDSHEQKQQTKDRSTTSSTSCPLEYAVEFARICGKLKSTRRTGWVYRNVPQPESVADHSWRVAALCLLFQQQQGNDSSIDVAKAMEMAIVHDLAESIIGDIAPSDNISKQEKQQLEHEAISYISMVLSNATDGTTAARLLAVLEEYEARETNTAKAVKDLDLLDMLIQATEYEEQYKHLNLQDFFDGTPAEKFQTVSIAQIAHHIHKQRAAASTISILHDNNTSSSSSSSVKEVPLQNIYDSPLSLEDASFVREFAASRNSISGMTSQDVEHVVRALRAYENRGLLD